MPEDGHCFDCGSRNIGQPSDHALFAEQLKDFKVNKDDVLGFYDSLGLLVDFEMRRGYEDYERLRDQIQIKCKH